MPIKTPKQIIGFLLALCMLLSYIPSFVYAVEVDDNYCEHSESCEHSQTESTEIAETTENTETSATAYTAEEVKAMIDALPDVSELEGMSEDEQSAVYEKAEEAYDAFETLTDEEQIELANDLEKLNAILERFFPAELVDADGYYKDFKVEPYSGDIDGVTSLWILSAEVIDSKLTIKFGFLHDGNSYSQTYTTTAYSCTTKFDDCQCAQYKGDGFSVSFRIRRDAGHYVTSRTSAGSTQHTGICEICGQTVTENHTGNATCSGSPCSTCGGNYIDPDNHELLDNGICGCGKTYQEAPLSDGVYQISNLGQLRWFAEKVNNGETSISGKLMKDIDATSLGYIGIGKDASHAFAGTFDGNNKTLKIALVSTEQYVAPFPYINGATIKNLTVSGTIKTTHKFAAGIVGRVEGGNANLENCLSLVEIDSTNFTDGNKNDGTHGGLIGVADGSTTTVNNCGFAGSIIGETTTACGGIVGWAGKTVKISNSFVAAKFTLKDNSGNTFARNAGQVTVTNCYYLNALSDAIYNGATQATADQFKSGEVAYKLNNGVTDGTQAWYQACQSDSYPKISGGTVYMGYICGNGSSDPVYRNTMVGLLTSASPNHDWNDAGVCNKCGESRYEAAVWNSSKNYYEISNAKQLYWFAALTNGTLTDGTPQNASANAILMKDIVVNTGVVVNGSLASDTSGFLSWTPIGDWGNNGKKRYSGSFDGNGHTVSGVYTTPDSGLRSFFGETDGSIKNLTISDSYFERLGNNAGGVVGYLDNGGTIENCFLVNSIVRGGGYVGGIVGVKADAGGTIKKCASINCNISGSRIVGGIVGNLSNGTIIDCYSTSNITASSEYCGGIAGIAQKASTIQNCYFAGQNNCNSYNGAITTVQNNSKNKITVVDCYYSSTVSCKGDVDKVGSSCTVTTTNVNKVTTDKFKTGEIAYLLNGSKSYGVWKQTIGKDTYPNFAGKTVYKITDCDGIGTTYSNTQSAGNGHIYDDNGLCHQAAGSVHYQPAEYDEKNNVYKIANLGNLLWFRDQVNGGDTKINAILTANINAKDDAAKIIGIGTNDNPFEGVFDGNSKTLDIQIVSTAEYAAPFAYVKGATIKNLTVTGSITSSQKFAASLVGQSSGNVTIEKCMSAVVITSTKSGDGTHGGLVANVSSGTMTINNCGFVGQINGSGTDSCGGLVGWSNGTTNISNSFVAATFSVNNKNGNTFSRGNNITVTNCYYLNALKDAPSSATQKSSVAFENGEITWLLNGSKSDGVWKQTLDTDTYPNFTGLTVYKNESGYPKYTNHASCTHDYDAKGFCTKCGGYQPAVLNGSVYEISNAGQLFWFAAFVNDGNGKANAVLKADIDLENRTWTPIGQYSDSKPDSTYNVSYEGTFDGQYHVIRNLNVKLTSTYEAGLFSRTYGATLKNFGVINATVESTQGIRSGVIGGEIHKSTVTNVFTAGSITVKTSNGQAGGIAGECADSTLTNCITTYGTLCATVGSVTNGFYLADTANANSVGEDKTKTQFESGELAWLLNGNSSEGVWKQTIGTDAYPNFTGKTVYYDANQNPQYYNDKVASVTITWTDMSFSYHKGTWNTDTMTWEGGGYVANEGCGTVTVTNTGNVDVNAQFGVTITDDSLGISVSFTENDVLLEDKKLKVTAGQAKTVAVKLTGKEPSEYIETAKTIGQITVTLSTE